MKVLIISDMQNDFLPGGALAVPGSDAVISVINQLMFRFDHVIASMDWHPPNHISFAKTHNRNVGDVIQVVGKPQILWPAHCVQNTSGASLSSQLHKERIEAVFHKGTNPGIDSYSAFFDNAHEHSTGLHEFLQKKQWKDLYFTGLATDYCILYSVLDALRLGYLATIIQDGCKSINLHPNDGMLALKTMKAHGAKIINSKEVP